MLGLIFGRRLGLAWVELKLCRFLAMGPSLGVSDFLAMGPLGEGMATVRGLGAIELEFRSTMEADLGSTDGVRLSEVRGVADPLEIVVSMREIWGRENCDAGAAASGRTTSSMMSSYDSDETSLAWPVK